MPAGDHVHLLQVMERVNQIILGRDDLAEVLREVLDEILRVFDCDRAWLLFPCDPDAASWQVPIERTRPAWPGAMEQGVDMPTTPDAQATFRQVLAHDSALGYHPDLDHQVPQLARELFSVQSQIAMAIRPRVGSPWVLGLHHCAAPQRYSKAQLDLFTAIGRRLADALGTLLTLRDLRQVEAQREALIGELRDRNAELADFVYTVSHQLRTPLITLLNFSEILQESASAANAGCADAAERVGSAARYMSELLDGLHLLLRVQRPTEQHQVRLVELVDQAVERLAPATECVHVNDDVTLVGDRGLLANLVCQLVDNALEFGRAGAEPCIDVSGESVDDGVRVRVEDDGPGIEPEYRERLFGLFETLDPRRGRTGIGLAVARRIVDYHGGWIRATDSTSGQGVAMEFWLPGASSGGPSPAR